MFTKVAGLQPRKASVPMLVTVDGMVMLVTSEQLYKALCAMDVYMVEMASVAGLPRPTNVSLLKEYEIGTFELLTKVAGLQPKKALFPMLVTDAGIVMLESPTHPENAD